MEYDLLIRHGSVYDGSLTANGYPQDIGICQGKIVAMGDLGTAAKTLLEADGLVVCPGFIDVHAHSEISVWQDPNCLAKASQGVTSELTGQCGISAYPLHPHAEQDIRKYSASVLGGGDRWPWRDLNGYRQAVSLHGMAINQGHFVGHGSLRINAMGFADRSPTSGELTRMSEMLSRDMEHGAFGMSSGLVYAPGVFSNTEELTKLANICAQKGGIYTSHIRNEGNRLLEAVNEAIAISKASGTQLILSHLKAVGKPNHGKVKLVLDRLEEEAACLQIYGDCYPYDASSTTMTVILPPWTMNGGMDGLVELLQNQEKRGEILAVLRNGMPGWDNRVTNIGYDHIRIASVSSEKNRNLEGLSLYEGGIRQQKDPGEFILDLLLEERGQVAAILQGMSKEDVTAALSSPRIMVCSDGIPVGEKHHPRLFGAFTRYLNQYADLSAPEGIAAAVHKLTAFPARIYSLERIGHLKPGYWADITLFDPNRVRDRATFAQPKLLSNGIEAVIVSGQIIFQDQKPTGKLPGRFLLHHRAAHS